MKTKGTLLLILLSSLVILNTAKAETIPGNSEIIADSLLKVIPTLKDTAKLKALIHLVYSTPENSGHAIEYCNLLFSEAKKQNNISCQSFALGKKVELQITQFNYDRQAIKEFEEFCKTHNYYAYYCSVELNIVISYLNQGKYILALNNAKLLYEKARELQNPEDVIRALNSIALVYWFMHNLTKAIEVQKECVQLTKNLEQADNLLLAELYIDFCDFYEEAKNYDTILIYADTLCYSIEKSMPEMPGYDYNEYFFRSGYYKCISQSYLGNHEKAYKYLQKMTNSFSSDWKGVTKMLLLQAQSTYYLNNQEYDKALSYINTAIQISRNNQLDEQSIILFLKLKAQAFFGMKKYKEAADLYRQINGTNDTLRIERYANQISELNTIYEVDKAKLRAAQATLKVKTFRHLIIGLVLISSFLITLVFLIYRNNNRLKQKNLVLFQRIKELNDQEIQQNEKKQNTSQALSGEDELYSRLNELMAKEKIFIDTTLTRKALSDKLNTNETYLFETIKKHLGITFSEYITGLRLNYARKLLSLTDNKLTVEAIAIDSGFGSRKTFHRLFRERYGLTPVEFRNMNTTDSRHKC
jgi:AraC-like DNA-binding protein